MKSQGISWQREHLRGRGAGGGGRGLEAQAPVSLTLSSSPEPRQPLATGLEQGPVEASPACPLSPGPQAEDRTPCRGARLLLSEAMGVGRNIPRGCDTSHAAWGHTGSGPQSEVQEEEPIREGRRGAEEGWGGAVGQAGPLVPQGGTQASQGVLEKPSSTTPCGDSRRHERRKRRRRRRGRGRAGRAHLQVGELLLLVRDGLLHQHALDALLHGVLLGLREKVLRSTGGPGLRGDGPSPASGFPLPQRPGRTHALTFWRASCCSGVRGGSPSFAAVLCPFSILMESVPW